MKVVVNGDKEIRRGAKTAYHHWYSLSSYEDPTGRMRVAPGKEVIVGLLMLSHDHNCRCDDCERVGGFTVPPLASMMMSVSVSAFELASLTTGSSVWLSFNVIDDGGDEELELRIRTLLELVVDSPTSHCDGQMEKDCRWSPLSPRSFHHCATFWDKRAIDHWGFQRT
jgi:hypothetical protein